jgi:hypothetical protein
MPTSERVEAAVQEMLRIHADAAYVASTRPQADLAHVADLARRDRLPTLGLTISPEVAARATEWVL